MPLCAASFPDNIQAGAAKSFPGHHGCDGSFHCLLYAHTALLYSKETLYSDEMSAVNDPFHCDSLLCAIFVKSAFVVVFLRAVPLQEVGLTLSLEA